MISEKDLMQLIEKVMAEYRQENPGKDGICPMHSADADTMEDGDVPDITAKPIQEIFYVPHPENKEEYLKLKAKTPARVGVWRAGNRYTTETMLRFRADHAVAMDAVFNDVPEDFVEDLGIFSVKTKCKDKDEYLTRPDLGRMFDEENLRIIKEKCKKNPKVQVYISDGLSSTAIEANVKNTLPAIMAGLKDHGIDAGTPFFVKYGRVGAMDAVAEAVGAELTCVLIGERPGLATGESMSCYMTYKGYPGIPEAKRTVVSNIHKNGTPSAEAGAHIAEILKKILENKASGVDLKL